MWKWKLQSCQFVRLLVGLALLILVMTGPQPYAADKKREDLDAYKLRVEGYWFYSRPTGTFEGANHAGTFDLHTDVGFTSYSTFSGKLDWKFTRKNHLYFAVTPSNTTKSFMTNRTIVFQG